MGRLSNLFAPETVAVVGATDRDGSVGRSIVFGMLAGSLYGLAAGGGIVVAIGFYLLSIAASGVGSTMISTH